MLCRHQRLGRGVLMKVNPRGMAWNSWAEVVLGEVQVSLRAKTSMLWVSNSGIVKRISERPDVKSAHIERSNTRNRSRIRHASTLRCEKEWERYGFEWTELRWCSKVKIITWCIVMIMQYTKRRWRRNTMKHEIYYGETQWHEDWMKHDVGL